MNDRQDQMCLEKDKLTDLSGSQNNPCGLDIVLHTTNSRSHFRLHPTKAERERLTNVTLLAF